MSVLRWVMGESLAVHLAGRTDDLTAKMLAHGLVAEADAQDGLLAGEGSL
jgi:hypothetical protein